jgi:uncharacterized membrane protein
VRLAVKAGGEDRPPGERPWPAAGGGAAHHLIGRLPCAARFRYSHRQEARVKPVLAHTLRSLQRNILAGIITIGPLFVTYLIFSFLLGTLAKAGLPVVQLFATIFPRNWLSQPWLQSILATVLTLVALYVVGRVSSLVIGRQVFNLFEATLERLPVVAKIYTSVRQLMDSMTAKKESSQRVVLVDFPIAGQKSIGFLTRTLTDEASGEVLAAVLLPNAINPTSAFLQILPMERVTETDLTMEQAMSMIMTGGAVGPNTIRFSRPAPVAVKESTQVKKIAAREEFAPAREAPPVREITPPAPLA